MDCCPTCGHEPPTPTTSDISSSPSATTHDISYSNCHIELPNWLKLLSTSLEAAWPKRHVCYSKVAVLILSWEDTDMPNTSVEIKRLQSVFQDAYHFDVESWQIPSVDPDLELLFKTQSLIKSHQGVDNLLIVYYAGHARPGSLRSAPPIWMSRRDQELCKEIDTAAIQSVLARAQPESPDVLMLYDCCNSLHAHQSNAKPARAVVECLFAGGFESKVPVAGPDSFTTALIDELLLAAESGRPLSVIELHRRVICRLQSWQPRAIFNVDGSIRKSGTGSFAFTQDSRITPAHVFLSVNQRPIFLSPLSLGGVISSEASSQVAERKDQSRDEDTMAMRVHGKRRAGRQPVESSDCHQEEVDAWPKVMLAVRLQDNENIQIEVERWLLTAPAGVVSFEGIHPSYSTILIVKLPVVLWDLLPPCPAVSFVGFISGPSEACPPATTPATKSLAAIAHTPELASYGEAITGTTHTDLFMNPNAQSADSPSSEKPPLDLLKFPSSSKAVDENQTSYPRLQPVNAHRNTVVEKEPAREGSFKYSENDNKETKERPKAHSSLPSSGASQGDIYDDSGHAKFPSSPTSSFPVGSESTKELDQRYSDEELAERHLSHAEMPRSTSNSVVSVTIPIMTAAAAAAVASSEPGTPVNRPSSAVNPPKARVLAWPRSRSNSSSSTLTSTSPKTARQPLEFDPARSRAPQDKQIPPYRRYSPDPTDWDFPVLPICPRIKEEAGHVDWLTLPGSKNFNICPHCYQAAFANTQFNHLFVPTPLNPPQARPTKCDFGTSKWYQIAWLLTHKYQRPDLRLFYDIANVIGSTQQCTGFRPDYRIWYTISDPASHRPVRNFNVCSRCAKIVEVLLPTLTGIFAPISLESSQDICAMRQEGYDGERKRFLSYWDFLGTTSDDALITNRAPDIRSLVDKIRKLSSIDECLHGYPVPNRKWYIMRSIPDMTICEECFVEVIWPELERDDSGVQADVLYRPQTLQLAACQLYSPRMRSEFRKAVKRNDLQYFESKVRQQRAKRAGVYRQDQGVRSHRLKPRGGGQ